MKSAPNDSIAISVRALELLKSFTDEGQLEICIHRFSVFVLSTSLYDPKTSQLFCFYSQSVLAVNTTRPAAERIKTKTA